MPGGRAALPLGGGVVGVIVTVADPAAGGGGYDVDSPFEQFPSQTQPAADRDVCGTRRTPSPSSSTSSRS